MKWKYAPQLHIIFQHTHYLNLVVSIVNYTFYDVIKDNLLFKRITLKNGRQEFGIQLTNKYVLLTPLLVLNTSKHSVLHCTAVIVISEWQLELLLNYILNAHEKWREPAIPKNHAIRPLENKRYLIIILKQFISAFKKKKIKVP